MIWDERDAVRESAHAAAPAEERKEQQHSLFFSFGVNPAHSPGDQLGHQKQLVSASLIGTMMRGNLWRRPFVDNLVKEVSIVFRLLLRWRQRCTGGGWGGDLQSALTLI